MALQTKNILVVSLIDCGAFLQNNPLEIPLFASKREHVTKKRTKRSMIRHHSFEVWQTSHAELSRLKYITINVAGFIEL